MHDLVDVDMGSGLKADERQVVKWLKLFWKSVEGVDLNIKDFLVIINILITVICVVVSYVRV